VEVIATDPDSVLEFPAWAASTGHELIECASTGSTYTFVIRHR
jgi:TusA-related sulfurtransferase